MTANGTASVTQRVIAKARIARHALPSAVSAIISPARAIGAGSGSASTPSMMSTATRMVAARARSDAGQLDCTTGVISGCPS